MKIARTAAELGVAVLKRTGPVFLVPTMGYFHEGHLSLMRMAAADRDAEKPSGTVVVSLFVNPTQFSNPRDLDAYPRDEARDATLARKVGCDVIFAPSVNEMYPAGFAHTVVRVPGLSSRWEGEHRPSHFEGVSTVVAKLFHLVLPDYAYFGEKDWQQCRVIELMVTDLDFPVWLRFGPTVREADGLAMSSRNALLRPELRAKAPALYQAISAAAESLKRGQEPRRAERHAEEQILCAGFSSVDYVAIVDAITLEPLDVHVPGGRVLAAASIGGVRLIDNVAVP